MPRPPDPNERPPSPPRPSSGGPSPPPPGTLPYLRGPAQQQAAGMAGPRARGGVWLVAVVGVVRPRRGPAAVVEGLLLGARVPGQQRPQGAGPGHVGVRQQGRGRRQLAAPPRAQEAVGRLGQDHDRGQRGVRAPAARPRLSRPPRRPGPRRGRRRLGGGAARHLGAQGVTLLLQGLSGSRQARRDPFVQPHAVGRAPEAGGQGLLLGLVGGAGRAHPVLHDGA